MKRKKRFPWALFGTTSLGSKKVKVPLTKIKYLPKAHPEVEVLFPNYYGLKSTCH